MPQPLVSVIVPNYRHAPYLRQRIDSILVQTCQDFELILLDDCSPDHSREILEQYRGHPRVAHIVYNPTNSGSAFKQWNKGMALAQGRYVWIAESDDWCEPTLLATLVGKLEQHPTAALAFCQSHIADDQGQTQGTYARTYSPDSFEDLTVWGADFVMPGPQFIADWLRKFNFIPNASAVLFRQGFYLRTDGAVESLKLTGDWLLWMAIAHQGPVCFAVAPLNYHRTHGQTVRAGFTALFQQEYPQVLAWLRDHLPAVFALNWRDHLHRIVAQALNGDAPFGQAWQQAQAIQPTSGWQLAKILLHRAGPLYFAKHLGQNGFRQLGSVSPWRGLAMISLAAAKSRRPAYYLHHTLYWLKVRWQRQR